MQDPTLLVDDVACKLFGMRRTEISKSYSMPPRTNPMRSDSRTCRVEKGACVIRDRDCGCGRVKEQYQEISLTAQMVSPNVEAHGSVVIVLREGDGHVRAVGAVGLHEDVPRLLVGAHVVLVKGLPTGEVPHSQQGAAGTCKAGIRQVRMAVGRAILGEAIHAKTDEEAREALLGEVNEDSLQQPRSPQHSLHPCHQVRGLGWLNCPYDSCCTPLHVYFSR